MLTGSAVEVTQAIVDLLETNEQTKETAIGLKDIYYGDTEMIPRVPAVSVLSSNKERAWYQTGMQTEITFTTQLLVFHSKIGDRTVTQKQTDQLVESIESLIHANKTFGGILIDSLVTEIEPGYASRGKMIFVTNRMTVISRSREHV